MSSSSRAFAPDPASRAISSIGGNVGTNAGGPHCLKYGVTSNHITELEIVLPDGSTTRLGSSAGDAWGPDLVGLFVGSEGMFGIALEITTKLVPLPRAVRQSLMDLGWLKDAASGEPRMSARPSSAH